MKKLEFETSKGRFLLVDLPSDTVKIENIYLNGICWKNKGNYFETWCSEEEDEIFYLISKVSETTEQQASEVVEETINAYGEHSFKYYGNDIFSGSYIVTAIESLHSLIKSKGWYLFKNPYRDAGLLPSPEQLLYREAESKTFYNPYLFRVKN